MLNNMKINKLPRITTWLAVIITAALALPVQAQEAALLVRLTVLETAHTNGPLDAAVQLLVIHRDPWHPKRELQFPGLTPGKPSEWRDTGSLLDYQNGVATVVVRLSSEGTPLSLPARVRVELARQGDKPLAAVEVFDGKGMLGLEMPERGMPDEQLAERLRSIRDIATAHVAFAAPWAVAEEDRPRHFIAATRPTVFFGYSDRSIARDEVRAVQNMGFNTMVNLPIDLADEMNVPYLAGADYSPPGIGSLHPDPNAAAAHYRKKVEQLVPGAGARHRLRAFAMSDEPSMDFPGTTTDLARDKDAVALFHDYLRQRHVEPTALGGASWEDITPVGPPEAGAGVERRRLWYHSARFAAHDQSRRFAVAAEALRREMGDQTLGFVNWNNPGIFFSDVSKWHRGAPVTGSHDWFEFSRLRGATCLWLGPGLDESGDWYRSTFRTWSMMLSLLRSAAAEGVGRFGAYVHHQFIPDERGYEASLSILAVAGHGGAGYNSYIWGPSYAFTEYMWSEKSGHYRYVADANRLIGRSEYLMVPGRPPEAQVAILWPVASQLHELNRGGYWTYNRDFLVEAQHVFLALNHRHIPVDFVDETMIRRGLPKRYRVLYITGPNLETTTMPALEGWVRRGGILWSGARALTHDEANEPTSAMNALLGIATRTVDRDPSDDFSPRRGLRQLRPMGRVTMAAEGAKGLLWDNYGARGLLKVAGAEVLGKFDDDTPAVLRRVVGSGEAWHVAGMPGLAYGKGAREREGRPTTDYPAAIGDLIAAPALRAGVARPAHADRPGVETAVLRSDQGVAVSLLNWEAQPIKMLEVVVTDVDTVARVRSARLGDLDYRHENREVRVSLPMPETIDVLLLDFADNVSGD